MVTRITHKRALWHLISTICFLYAPVLAQDVNKPENGDIIKLEEGDVAPISGYLINEDKLNKCLQSKIDLDLSETLIGKQKDLIATYEKKDVSVKSLIESVDHLTKILDYYKITVDGLIDTQKSKSKFPKFGVYGGINSLTLDSKVGTGYNIGVFISF